MLKNILGYIDDVGSFDSTELFKLLIVSPFIYFAFTLWVNGFQLHITFIYTNKTYYVTQFH